ncbi:uncharacterized protein [Macrobrachium rosenbergii]|uniref:uncharacterized protein isoform X1 n=1 Tax=Macrobrachium rosenbergii TaxID=79674 RepID=UPI0034D501E7
MDVTSPPDGNNTMVPPSILLQDAVTVTPTSSLDEETLRRQKELEEFYSTYDVWTGIRTAITLALFFIFTVTLILYKSKCKPRRKYELYPSLEDMPGRPLDYCDYWCASPVSNETGRKSTVDSLGGYCGHRRVESGSAPLPTKRTVGSYSSLNNSFRVKSLPGSVMRINCSRMSSFERDDVSQATAHSCRSEFLRVPGVRLQSTGSSSDGYSAGSSTHDLPSDINSVGLLGVPGLGPRGNKPLLQLGGMDWDSDHATAEWVQTIDINVIQPTPNISPCGSVRSVSDNSELVRLPLPGRGRVTSVLSIDSPDYDSRSIGSDSVFLEDSVGETGSSFSESMDSGTPSLLATPQTNLSPSPRFTRRKVQSFRLGINPAHRPASPSLSAPVRMQTLSNLHRPAELRGRKKPLQRQKVQDLSTAAIPVMGTLLVPTLGSNLTASCERLAAHSALTSEASLGSSRGSTSLAPTSSVEDEPMCAVFTVPALRRTNSATTPEMKEEAAASAASFKRADSEQNPAVRRADSATDPQRQSSESSSGSEASDSVSFHLMVPELSVDIPSADTSRASTPTLSPMGSPIASPRTSRLSTSRSNSLEPTPSIKRKGSKRGAGGSAKASGRNGKRVLKRQHNVQCPPVSPTFKHDPPVSQSSLPTYMEEEDDDDDDLPPLPPAPPSSPYPCAASPTGGGRQSLQREDSSPSSPTPPNNVMETSC